MEQKMQKASTRASSAKSANQLAEYTNWLRRRGLGADSIKQYVYQASRLLKEEDPFIRLTNRTLSPKYRRACKAAFKSYAKFTKDTEFAEELEELKLPAAIRVNSKNPLSEKLWKALRLAIDESTEISPPMRAELGIMITRGLRKSDVLRLHRDEIATALKKGVLSYVGKGEKITHITVGDTWRKYLELFHKAFLKNKNATQAVDLISTSFKSAGTATARALRKVARNVKGIEIADLHPHLLRHTYATAYFEACGRDPAMLQQHLNWSDISTAMRYVGQTDAAKLDAIASKMF